MKACVKRYYKTNLSCTDPGCKSATRCFSRSTKYNAKTSHG